MKIEVRHETYTDGTLSGMKQWVGYIDGVRVTAGRVTRDEALETAKIEASLRWEQSVRDNPARRIA